MIVGHCPECGADIAADASGKVVTCMHTTTPILILASLFGQAFDQACTAAPDMAAPHKEKK